MTTSSNAKLLIQQIEVYNMSELVHAALHDEDFDHYGVKGMKWYQHIFTKEGRAERRANKPRNKYKSISELPKGDLKAKERYLGSVTRGRWMRIGKTVTKRVATTAIIAAASFLVGGYGGYLLTGGNTLPTILTNVLPAVSATGGALYNKFNQRPYWKTPQEQDANQERRRLMSDEEDLDEFKKKQRYRGH